MTDKIKNLSHWLFIAVAFLVMSLNSTLEHVGLSYVYVDGLLRFTGLSFYFVGFLSCLLKTELYEKLGLLAFTAWILGDIL